MEEERGIPDLPSVEEHQGVLEVAGVVQRLRLDQEGLDEGLVSVQGEREREGKEALQS